MEIDSGQERSDNLHLKILAALSRKLMHQDFRDSLLACATRVQKGTASEVANKIFIREKTSFIDGKQPTAAQGMFSIPWRR